MPFLHIFSLLRSSLFVYQQELYDAVKLLKYFYSKRIFEVAEKRQALDFTAKVKSLYLLTVLFAGVSFVSIALQFWWYSSFILFVIQVIALYFICLGVLPFFLITSHVVLSPLDFFLKQKRIMEAKKKIEEHQSHLTVIGVTGSYGKTSVKELLKSVLSQKYSVITTEENKNTPLGIAQIVDNINITHQFFIVEMGAYYRGDIKELCEMVQPEYGVLTGINEQHLERQGSLENIIKTKNELSAFLPQNGKLWVNGNNKIARENVGKYAKCSVDFYDDANIQDIEYAHTGEQKITLQSEMIIESRVLADYFPSLVDLAFKVGKTFGLSDQEVKRGLENVVPPEHRLSPRYFKDTDILIIDDAFNGNPDGALAAMKTLSHFQKQRRIYLTPGLVELGDQSPVIHESLGKNLAFHTDEVWLIQNSVTDFIRAGLEKSHFPEERIRIFPSATEAHAACKNLPSGTVLLMQNDWTDNYQ